MAEMADLGASRLLRDGDGRSRSLGTGGERIFIPTFSTDWEFWTTVVAILGTTISPYLFFWQASQEVEEIGDVRERKPLLQAPEQGPDAIGRIELDTYVGMGLSNLVSLAIMVTAAATLHAAGVTDVQTSAQAAEALKPVAGELAFAIFSLGIVGTGLLAVPVLAGSAAYALCEFEAGRLAWRENRSRRRRSTARSLPQLFSEL